MKLMKGTLRNEGMGGFLAPPTHPEHEWSIIEVDGRKNPDNLSASSLTGALGPESGWDGFTRGAAKGKLRSWQPLPIDDPAVQDWIRQVLGYFRGCYCNLRVPEPERWRADAVLIDNRNPLENAEDHAGVHLIRGYYPEYMPTAEQFAEAYWGMKPTKGPEKPTTEKIRPKQYRCTGCGTVETFSTNHYGEHYSQCRSCPPYKQADRVWKCMESVPEGMDVPAKWNQVRLGDIAKEV